MAGMGRNARGGKRGSSSSSSFMSTTTMLVLVGFGVFGMYMFSSSSTSSSNVVHHNLRRNKVPFSPPRTALRDPLPVSENTQEEFHEEVIQGDHHHQQQRQEEHVTEVESAGTEEDSRSQTEAFHQQQQEDVETNRHEQQQDQHVESQSADDQQQQQQSDAGFEKISNEEQQHNNEEEQQQQQQSEEQSNKEQSNGEQVESEISGHQDHNNNLSEKIEIDDSHEQNQQIIQQVTDGSHTHSEEDGITSQSQVEHDTDGTTDNQHQQEQQQEQHQQEQEQQQQEHESLQQGQQKDEQYQEQQQQQQQDEQHREQQYEEQQQDEQHREQQYEEQPQEQQQQQQEPQYEEQHQERQIEEQHQEEKQQTEEPQYEEQHQEQQVEQQRQEERQQTQEPQYEEQHQEQQVEEQHQEENEEQHQEQQQQQEQQYEQQHQPEQEQHQHEQQQHEEQHQEFSQQQKMEEDSTNKEINENNQQNEDNRNALQDSHQSTEKQSNKNTWATQADQSSNEKERRKGDGSPGSNEAGEAGNVSVGDDGQSAGQKWALCNVTAGPDYIPCLDNEKAIKKLNNYTNFQHRERHCPEESPTCLVPLPKGYKHSIEWPQSRDRIWYNNVPHTKLAEVKGHQNWVKVTGEYLTFPGGGTQFIHGALHYIDFIQKSFRDIAWGKRTRVILDVGCGVASFGGYLFERDVLAMSFAPKDEHEAQVQFALERGIPAISAVMGSKRLPFPSRVFDLVHCARCRVPWHANGGALLLELNRVLRPGGYFVWSATPVYQKLKEDVEIWEAMKALTKSMCWDLVTIHADKLNSVGAAIYRKPVTNDCYDKRNEQKPPMCKHDDDPNAAWYVPLQSCMHRVPVDPSERGSQWPEQWPKRVQVPPYWLNSSQVGVYGRPAIEDFTKDYAHWKRVVDKSYLNGFGIDWSRVRNVMDMRAVYGGFAAALRDKKVWVMNLVNIDSPDTLPIIYERGLFGMYHDWCESFSTYPRTYDLLHAERLFSQVKKRCKILPVIAEVDRIVRPGGKIIVRDESQAVSEVENLLKSLHWDIRLSYSKNQEGILCAEKSDWRPVKYSDYST